VKLWIFDSDNETRPKERKKCNIKFLLNFKATGVKKKRVVERSGVSVLMTYHVASSALKPSVGIKCRLSEQIAMQIISFAKNTFVSELTSESFPGSLWKQHCGFYFN
jgi:hypothetical protein